MLNNITIGQYVPRNSLIHRLDPRTKILATMIFIIIVFFAENPIGYLLLGLFSLVVILMSKLPLGYVLKGLRPLVWIVIFTLVLNLFMTKGNVIWQFHFLKITDAGVKLGIYMSLRILFLVLTTSLLTLTTSPIALTDGIEKLLKPFSKIGVPSHELAMMMTIALRFIPTLLEETDKIMKAQMARGADFESGNIVKKAMSLIPILVPLFVGSFRRADELAMAMEARCYRGGDNRTRMKELHMHSRDYAAFTFMIVFSIALVWLGRGMQ